VTRCPDPFSENGTAEGLAAKRYCPYCGLEVQRRAWEGMCRRYCRRCRRPIYDNPVPAVCAVLQDARSRVLLVQRSIPPRKGEWCLPGGFMELGETPEAAVLRELQEETGLVGGPPRLIGLRATPNRIYDTVLVAGYRVVSWEGVLRSGDDAMAADWFAAAALPPIAFGSHRAFVRSVAGDDAPMRA
jgi:ADP-ribose pyrophosphatase YjhB (NUDIX family)